MRSLLSAAIAAAALMLAAPGFAGAQDEPPPPKAEPAPALPDAPIPYTTLHPKRSAKPKPKPTAAPSAAVGVAGMVAPPRQAGAPPSVPPKATAPKLTAAIAPAPPPPAQPGARLGPGQPLPPAELEAFVDGVVRDAMQREHIAGVTVSVVQNGQVVLKKGYGFASLRPARAVDPDRTLFRIGSITKTFTWIAVMKEVEAGRMRLDQPVNLYLPEKVQVKDQGFDQPIRVINLMDHSPGFEDRALGHLFEDSFDRVRPLEVYLRQERPKRVRAPGLVSSYSNYGAALAGEAAAWTSGKPYERLIEEDILGPARMAYTSFREPHPAKAGLPPPMPAALAADVSDGFRWSGTGFQRRAYEYVEQIAPAGAGSSTAGDMARYLLLQLGNGSLEGAAVYGPATAQAFRTPIRPTPPGINGWAHGFIVHTLPGGFKGYGHDGGTLSFFSNMTVVPQLNLGLFVATNTESGAALSARLAPAVLQQFYAPPQSFPRAASPELAGRGELFNGYYLGTRRAYSGLEGFVMRIARAGVNVTVTPDGRLVLADMTGASTWVPEGPVEDGRFIAPQDESRLAFLMKDGRATGFLPGGGSILYERVSAWQKPSRLAWLAGLTAFAAVATLLGLIVRSRRDFRQSATQARASLVQNIQAGLWLAALMLFGLFVSSATADLAPLMYGWPSPLIVLASACALVASALTLVTVLVLPAIWSGGRRVDSWSYLRKFSFTATVAIYLAFAVMLGSWGALSPWSG
ncbi:MAG: beta-lactamase class [Phenylobacterium sp.]|nr:beta-lactamase class [Phenylobacterium sp.]